MKTRMSTHCTRVLLAPLLALAAVVCAAGLGAQAATDEPAALRGWYNELPAEQKRQLRHRMRVFKRMSPEQQQAAREAARAGKPIFTAEQRANIERLRAMNRLERLRLFTLAHELQQLRRGPNERARRLLEGEGPDRVRELHRMLRMRRAQEFGRSLPPEKQRELNALPERERIPALQRMYEQDTRERRRRLEQAFPAIEANRRLAREGDTEARALLRRQLADLWTLDLMLQRLRPQAREKALAKLSSLSIEQAGEMLHNELRRQWQREMPPRGPGRDGPPRPRERHPRD